MIGLGKWQADINNMFFNGTAFLTISDNNGAYKLSLDLPGEDFEVPEIHLKEVEEDEDTLIIVANVDMLKGKDIDITLTFDGDTCNGFLKIPFVGKIKFKDAKRV